MGFGACPSRIDSMGSTACPRHSKTPARGGFSAGPAAHAMIIGRMRSPDSLSLWSPVRVPTFRNLLMADVLSDIGTFMQSVGAAWLMVSFGAGPLYVALTQTASSLPFFVFALPAGSVGDIVDRRKLILYTEFWMVGVATA